MHASRRGRGGVVDSATRVGWVNALLGPATHAYTLPYTGMRMGETRQVGRACTSTRKTRANKRVLTRSSLRLFEKPIGAQLKALRLLIGRTRAEAQRGEGEGLLARLR